MPAPSFILALTMAWRETRGHWRQFVFFFGCLAVGVGAVVGIDLFATNVERLILRDARSLLGGDVEIRLARPLSASGGVVVGSLRKRNVDVTHVSELVAMAAASVAEGSDKPDAPSTQLVELKAVEPNYPLYGTVDVNPPQSLRSLLASRETDCPARPCFGIVVQESLLIGLGIQLHDHLTIGHARFRVTGILGKEPDRVASAFRLGPRVLMSRQALAATDLVKRGSRIRERYLLRVPESRVLDPLVEELQGRLSKEGANVSSYRDAQPRIRRFLDQLSTYLGLIGLTALFVGGIGIACTVHGFMKHKLMTVAIFKTLGADAGFIMKVYLLQSVFLGCLGSVVGVALGVGLQRLLPVLFGELIPLAVRSRVDVLPLSKGMLLGALTTLCFVLWPLLTIRSIPPAIVFRREVDQERASVSAGSHFRRMKETLMKFVQDRHRLGTALLMGCGLTVLSVWQARSLTLGFLFIVAFGAALLFIQFGVWVLLHGLRKIPRSRSFAVRHAMGNVQRPGNYTLGMAVAIGVGVMVIVTVALVKSSLLVALGERIPEDAPTFFFIDVQPDQRERFERVMQREARTAPYRLTPVVRSRLGAIDGRAIHPDEHKDKRNGWYFTREYVLTALSELPRDNIVAKGRWWPSESEDERNEDHTRNPIRVSVEDEAAENLGVDLGSTLEFNIQGTPLRAVVESTRTVDWGSFSTNFFMILSPGALDGAPMTYIASAKVEPEEEMPLQRALVRALPNVTAIKIGDVLANVARLLEQLAWAIQGVTLLSMTSCAVVMIAALSSTRYRRLYESAILKAIGGTRQIIVKSFAVEFALVGGLAGLIGVGLASALSWVILHFFLDVAWTVQPMVLGWGLLTTVGLAVAVGFLSTFKILGEPPLAVLRQE